MFNISYQVTMQQVDASGNPIGNVYGYSGKQIILINTPVAGDINTACTAMGTDIASQMNAAWPTQVAVNSTNASQGGQG